MTRQVSFRFARRRGKRAQPALTGPYAEWRDTLRDTGDMLSGIYQDLRGDLADAAADFARGLRRAWRRQS